MPLIPEGVIDEIQSRTDIADLIGRYMPLKRAGRHFKAPCPFHKEKTPSFMVNTDKQIFHCFGCGVGGNIFSFLMQHDRLTFPEAVQQLADHVGIRVPDQAAASDGGAKASLVAFMEKVCRYYERMFLDPKGGTAARAYVEQRRVSERTRQQFRLGFVPPGWNQLLNAAKATGVSVDQLEAAGLVIQGRSGHYDRFRHRLIFPIVNVRGQVVGFGGRSLDGQEPKYLNSPETALYTKGRHLFGLVHAKEAIIQAKTAVVVEGYFDCVTLVDAGVTHVVSPLGTALTTDQIRLLKRYTDNVILAFDADAAGEQATLRGIDLLVESGLHIRVAQLPQGVDPDDYLKSYGREGFQQLLDRSLGIFDFLVQSALKRYPGDDPEPRVKAAQFVLHTVVRVTNAMTRSEYVRLLAERLHLDEGAMMRELGKIQAPAGRRSGHLDGGPARPGDRERRAGGVPGAVVRTLPQGSERLLTALVLDDPARWATPRTDRVALDEVTDPHLRRILTVVCELGTAGLPATPAQVISRVSEEGQASLVTELVELAHSTSAKDSAFEDCLRRVRTNTRQRELANIREQIQTAQDAGHDEHVQRLLVEYQHHLEV